MIYDLIPELFAPVMLDYWRKRTTGRLDRVPLTAPYRDFRDHPATVRRCAAAHAWRLPQTPFDYFTGRATWVDGACRA